ncbi:MAG TPA: single-stranded-DNA-specific exonuclease RecJ [Thermoanaerobacterales bacterium]|nr:single-stranded-DNA-specific exonuclease RecJ [Thermoanaerobacterales bacterium]
MIFGNYIWQVDSVGESDGTYGNLHPIILQLLKKRGIVTPEQIQRYLFPKLEYLYNPMLLKDMDKAVRRIKEALAKQQRIVVYGDYDVDGITSCAILVKLLKSLGGNVHYYIPSRLDEGYGLNKEAIEEIHSKKTDLIITVDNGISSNEEVKYASSLGLDVIITDHHEPQLEIPQAIAVINPKQRDCSYPFKELAGVGVALKLAHALMDTYACPQKLYQEFLELAAIGTVADMVILLDENRIIVKNGLENLAFTDNKGLLAMMALLNLKDTPVEPSKISYLLAPRINAAGRIADPKIAVELLLSENEDHAFELANKLEKINQERQALEVKVLEEAKEIIEQKIDLDTNSIIVVSSPNWHPGVIGTVASKLVEIYCRPCIMIAEQKGEGRGSGRSVSGFNLFKAIGDLSNLLIKYGGHEQAVGLKIKVENIDLFREKINELHKDAFKKMDLRPKLDIDLELNKRDLTLQLAQQLELMKPFGYGNPKPVFICRNLHILDSRTVGNGDKHLKLNLKSHEANIDAIGFNFGLYKEDLEMASIMDLAFNLEVNRWKGFEGLQLNIKDLKVPFLRDKLLDDVEKNYYKYFLLNLNNRNSAVLTEKKGIDKSNFVVLANKTTQERMNYIKGLFETQRKVIIVVNTPYKAWQLLTYLNGYDSLINDIKVFYDLSSIINNSANNFIVVDPFAEVSDENFDDIVFFDTPFSIKLLNAQLTSLPSTSKIHILFKRGHLRYNFLVCRQILPSVNQLKAVYHTVGKLTAGKFVCTLDIYKLIDILHEQYGIDMHTVGLINVFNIFQDLNIIKFNQKGGLLNITDYRKHDSTFKLESSRTYMLLHSLAKDVVEFYNEYLILQSKLF